MIPLEKSREQRRLAGVKSGELRRLKTGKKMNGRSTTVERKANENEQSKVKESIVEKSKENKQSYLIVVSYSLLW